MQRNGVQAHACARAEHTCSTSSAANSCSYLETKSRHKFDTYLLKKKKKLSFSFIESTKGLEISISVTGARE